MYAAIENGYYEEEGLKVNIQFPSSTNDAISLTAAGKADVGIYYLHNVVETNVEQGVPIRSIGTLTQSPLTIFASLKESNIKTAADMAGKTIGSSSSEITQKVIGHIMKGEGYSLDDVEIIDIGFDHLSALATGSVDVTYGSMVNHEVPQLEKEGFDVDYFFPTDYGMPNYYEMIFITGEKQIKDDNEKLAAFLRASVKGFDFVKENPEKALDILFENQNEENFPLDREVEEKSLDILLPVMETENADFLSQDLAIWQENIDWLYDNDMLSKTINAEEIVVDIIE